MPPFPRLSLTVGWLPSILAANWLSQQKGVDLAGFPKTREGQSVKMEAQDFRVQLSGIKTAAGGLALVNARFEQQPFPGGRSFSSVSIPAGGCVLLPETKSKVTGPSDSGGFAFNAPNRRALGLVMISPHAPPSAA